MKTLLNRLTGRSAALLLALVMSGCNLPLQKPDCPPGQSLGADQLLGNWTLHIAGMTTPWALRLAPHPEHMGSLRGELRQSGQRYPVVADLEGREFTMEESHDGQRIAATWLGTALHGHCGRWIEGERLATGQAGQGFTMRPAP
jgi:hypothetical protein